MLNLEGTRLKGRYRIEQLIGRGGMAEVYKAWDTSRTYYVAIKVMREDLAEDLEFVRRFQGEAGALAALSHTNIIRFYSFEKDGPLAFIVMDYVAGITLRRRILEGSGAPLPPEEVTSITQQVCAALHYAHTENVLHRDIKPGNIMLQDDGHVLVADFGIAKAADAATATTVMPGTPAYMSPEQCRSELLDIRTDLYSLGVVVYEMLAGRRPFVGERAEVSTHSTREMIRWEQLHAPPPPLREFNPAVSAEVQDVVLKALAKQRTERWRSVAEFWQAFQAVAAPGVSQDLVTSGPPPPVAAGPLPPPMDPRAFKPISAGYAEPRDPAPPAEPVYERSRPRLARFPPWVWLAGGLLLAGLAVGGVALGGGVAGLAPTPTTQVVVDETQAATPLPTATADDMATEVAWELAKAATLTALAPTATIVSPDTPTTPPTITRTPKPTNTPPPAPTETRRPAVTPPPPTSTPSYTPFPTWTPSSTPPPTLTPTSVASCPTAVYSRFQSLWSAYRDVLGCPTTSARSVYMAQESFQSGRMFWRSDTGRHYVVYSYGSWQSYRDSWQEGDPEFTCGTPTSPPTPKRGFGKVWCTESAVRNGLGYATTGEWAETNTIQEFQGGWMMRTEGGAVIAFFSSGGWKQ